MTMNDALAGYFAGFFDGEGTVYAATRTNRKDARHNRPHATILVCVSNTNKAVLDLHREIFGGSLCVRKGKNYESGNWREQWQLVLSPRKAEPYLRIIHPHLIIKKEVAALALEYLALVHLPMRDKIDYSKLKRTKDGTKWTTIKTLRPEHAEKLLVLHAQIRALNKRGAPLNARRQRNPFEQIADADA